MLHHDHAQGFSNVVTCQEDEHLLVCVCCLVAGSRYVLFAQGLGWIANAMPLLQASLVCKSCLQVLFPSVVCPGPRLDGQRHATAASKAGEEGC